MTRAGGATADVLLAALALGLVAAEIVWPLRQPTERRGPRLARNLAIAGAAGVVVGGLENPLVRGCAKLAAARRWGVTPRLPLPEPLRIAAGVALMDYTLYLWHVLMHRNPALWRMHAPHHADLDLDASTALRFHFTELVASIPWRVAQVVLVGGDARVLTAWRRFTFACILFHHSNLRLPPRLERAVGLVLATPRMHGIHHSTVAAERDSNWSSGLSLWDRLHGTLRWSPPQPQIQIGLPGLRQEDVGLASVFAMPFARG